MKYSNIFLLWQTSKNKNSFKIKLFLVAAEIIFQVVSARYHLLGFARLLNDVG